MKLSEELEFRGLINQTTLKNITRLDSEKFIFYFGVDPSSDSMTIGNLASLMVVRLFLQAGHQGILLLGGATGLIGDPDETKKRTALSRELIQSNVMSLEKQYLSILEGLDFEIVNNYDWFKGIGYLDFLREVGTHIPLRTMLNRDFVIRRTDDPKIGLNYAEFSYSLVQGYDFYHLNKTRKVNLQLCGSDQWGNSVAGVDLVRRISNNEVEIFSTPLVIDKKTGRKFGKSEEGAIWLSSRKTSVLKFYQFFINLDDQNIEYYLKIYTSLSVAEIKAILKAHNLDKSKRIAQKELAYQVTSLVHGNKNAQISRELTHYLTGESKIDNISETELDKLHQEIPVISTSVINLQEILLNSGLVKSKTEAQGLINSGAIYLNNLRIPDNDSANINLNRINIIRKGKAYKDSVIVIIK